MINFLKNNYFNKKKSFYRVDIQVSIFTIIILTIVYLLLSYFYYNIAFKDMLRSLGEQTNLVFSYVDENTNIDAILNINTAEDVDKYEYRNNQKLFFRTRMYTGVNDIYSVKKNINGDYIYVVDSVEKSAYNFKAPGTLVDESLIPSLDRAYNGEVVYPDKIIKTNFGKVYKTYIPVYQRNVVAGVVVIELLANHQYDTYITINIAMFILIFIACILVIFFSNILFKRISNPSFKDIFNSDQLTKLKNRNAYELDINNFNAQKAKHLIGIYTIDLNNLKKVNDTLGHNMGDKYLQLAARALKLNSNKNMLLYRTGGDEFVIISLEETLDNMEIVKNKIYDTFEKIKPKWNVKTSLSIGYALYDDSLDESLLATFTRADKNMYVQKQKFHNNDK